MKRKVILIIGFIFFVFGIITSYIDSARVRNGVEPRFVIKIVNNDGNKISYWGFGYKVIRYPSVSPNEPYKNNRGVKYGNWFMKYELSLENDKVKKQELEDINNKIIEYFSLEENIKYGNYSYNYIDYENMVVVVGLKDNSLEEQDKFREIVVDSKLIRFEKGEITLSNNDNIYEIELKKEIEAINHGNSPDDLVKYKVYVKDSKLYAINLGNNEERIVFDLEIVDYIAVRNICCTGNAKLLILTKDGNVYMSEDDCNYNFSFDFTFKKLDVTNIVSFKLMSTFENDIVKKLYGVDIDGNEILLD